MYRNIHLYERSMRFIVLLLLGTCLPLSAQQYISGTISDADTGNLMAGVNIIDLVSGQWTISGDDGAFIIETSARQFELHFQILGKETYVLDNEGADGLDLMKLSIVLKDKNLRLDEVEVTGVRKRDRAGSSVLFDKYAISQVQAFSLAEILQQLPGSEIRPSVLNEPQTISLRTAMAKKNNAFGVSYVLDGMQLSNDENMQLYNTKASGVTTYDNVNTGYDLRSIPASNIESVEVIAGIPDAKYGNLTSGIIKIDRRAGVSPYRVSANIRQGKTSVSIDKGLRLDDRNTLSLSADYLNSNADPRNSLEQFDRITTGLIWSTVNQKQVFKNTLSVTLRKNLDDMNYDKDNNDGGQVAKYKKETGILLSNRAKWALQSRWMDNLGFQAGISYASQESYDQQFVNNGGKVVPLAMETALQPGAYTPVAYLMKKQVFGKPLNVSARLDIDKYINTGGWGHSISYGADFSLSDNLGRGRIYDPSSANAQVVLSGQSTGDEGVRPLDFNKYVQSQKRYGVYFQDNIRYTFANDRKLYANIGMRYDNQSGYSGFSPRVNLGYELSDKVKVRFGTGFASKAPSLSNLFPGDKYFDYVMADFRTNYYSYNLVQTFVKKIDKQELKPSKSWKFEVGADISTAIGNISLTSYYNRSYDGFMGVDVRELRQLPRLEFDFPEEHGAPTYTISGYDPTIIKHSLSVNSSVARDFGLEFMMHLKKIRAINTSFAFSGAYTFSDSSNGVDLVEKTDDPLEKEYLYGYYHKANDKFDALRLRLTATHHIPDIGLLISLTAEQFTRTTSYAVLRDNRPFAYANANLEYFEIPEAERDNQKYSPLWKDMSVTQDRTYPAYHNFHLRVTKEMLNGLSLSFYAYNFLNYRPYVKILDAYSIRNQKVSFGGNVKFVF